MVPPVSPAGADCLLSITTVRRTQYKPSRFTFPASWPSKQPRARSARSDGRGADRRGPLVALLVDHHGREGRSRAPAHPWSRPLDGALPRDSDPICEAISDDRGVARSVSRSRPALASETPMRAPGCRPPVVPLRRCERGDAAASRLLPTLRPALEGPRGPLGDEENAGRRRRSARPSAQEFGRVAGNDDKRADYAGEACLSYG